MAGEAGDGGIVAAPPAPASAADSASGDDIVAETHEPAAIRSVGGDLLPLHLAVAALWLTFWCVDIVSPGLPVLQDDLGLSDTLAGLVFSAFFAGRLIANLPAAILVDRRGARITAALGASLLLVGSVGAAGAASAALLLPARVVQGTGVSVLVAAALLSTLRAQPAGGAAMTTFNLAAGVGGACGLISGGFLAGEVGWRAIFWLSALLAGAMVAGALFAGRVGPGRRPAPPASSSRFESAAQTPAGQTGSRRPLVIALLANLLVYANYSLWVVSLPLYADQHFAASTGLIAALLIASNGIHLLGAFPSGRAVRRWGSGRALVAGFALTAAGSTTMLLAPAAWWLLPPLALYALGQVCSTTAAGDQVLRLGGQGGRAVGLVRFSTDVGLVLGPAAVGALADVLGVASPFAVLAALTGVFALALWRDGQRGAQEPLPL